MENIKEKKGVTVSDEKDIIASGIDIMAQVTHKEKHLRVMVTMLSPNLPNQIHMMRSTIKF